MWRVYFLGGGHRRRSSSRRRRNDNSFTASETNLAVVVDNGNDTACVLLLGKTRFLITLSLLTGCMGTGWWCGRTVTVSQVCLEIDQTGGNRGWRHAIHRRPYLFPGNRVARTGSYQLSVFENKIILSSYSHLNVESARFKRNDLYSIRSTADRRGFVSKFRVLNVFPVLSNIRRRPAILKF